jgi:hypothetical protein
MYAAALDKRCRRRPTAAADALHTRAVVTDPAATAGAGGFEVVVPVAAAAVELLPLQQLLLLLLGSSCEARFCAASPVIINGLSQQRSTP